MIPIVMAPARKSETRSLGRLAARSGLLYGASTSTADLTSPYLLEAILRDCSIITPEYELKWDKVSPTPGEPDFRGAERLAAFAAGAGIALRGHTLWWHEAIPPWLAEATSDLFVKAAQAHLASTVSRFAGGMHSWDVVNEPLHLEHGRDDGLRRSPFLEALGPGYLGLAFKAAADLDPGAVLVLNEMGLEYASPAAEAKRLAMLRLIERERKAGTPIHALGLQAHLDAMDQPRRHPQLSAFLREIGALGLTIMITEMDVSDARCPRDRRVRDTLVAETYRCFLEVVLESCTTLAVQTWGLSDARTWLTTARPRPDGAALRPLPLDRAGRRKPAWHALAAALSAPAREDPRRPSLALP